MKKFPSPRGRGKGRGEVDGGQHAESQRDDVRDQCLKGQGFELLRFWNHDALGNRDGVLQIPLPRPPHRGREVISAKLSVNTEDKKIKS